jgi:Secretion system C-terminal sorting domain
MKTTLLKKVKSICIFLFSVFIFCNIPHLLMGQKGKDGTRTLNVSDTVIVNRYSSLATTANAGDLFVTVVNITELSGAHSFTNSTNAYTTSNLAAGDIVLIIQMQGVDINTSNTSSFGNITGYNGTGNYEIAVVGGISGNTISFCSPLLNTYITGGTRRSQVVRLPRFNNLTVATGTTVSGKQWNGTNGGIVTMEVRGNLIINGNISASEIGFRGGVDNIYKSDYNVTSYFSNDDLDGAGKGEGIAGNTNDYFAAGYKLGRGSIANGGGGANAHNTGGGGGSNAGINANLSGYNGTGIKQNNPSWNSAWAIESSNFHTNVSPGGGRGGYSYSSENLNALTIGPSNATWGGDDRHNNAGFGGRPLDYSSNTKLFMGGGGGSGDGNNESSGFGGNGGGVILIYNYGTITGNGTAKISANGQNGFDTNNEERDGAGGGGGGGAVIVQSKNSITGILIEANGGNGGRQTFINDTYKSHEAEGPGGGGGGGYILTSSTLVSRNVNGGSSGYTNSDQLTEFTVNGSTNGAEGTTITNAIGFDFGGCGILENASISLKALAKNSISYVEWSAEYIQGTILKFELELGNDGNNFHSIYSEQPQNGKKLFNYEHNRISTYSKDVFYRVKALSNTGKIYYSNTVRIASEQMLKSSSGVFPNPAAEKIWVKVYMQNEGVVDLQLTDAMGRVQKTATVKVGAGTQLIELNKLSHLNKGVYALIVRSGNHSVVHNLVIK